MVLPTHSRYILLLGLLTVLSGCPKTYTVGGVVSGLKGQLLLRLNSFDPYAIQENGAFAFPDSLSADLPYEVVIEQQPEGQTCEIVAGAQGVGADGDVTSVEIACVDNELIQTLHIDDDADGSPERIIQKRFDFRGNLTEQSTDTNADGEVDSTTVYSYDSAGNLIAFTDAEGRTTQYDRAYDQHENLIALRIINPAGVINETQYEYDPSGNLVFERKDLDGNSEWDVEITYSYSSGSLLTHEHHDYLTDSSDDIAIAYVYDERNRLAEKRKDVGLDGVLYITRYEYDESGNVISQIDIAEDGVYDRVLQNTWDEGGNLIYTSLDLGGDGSTDVTGAYEYLVDTPLISRFRMDSDGDGSVDVITIFEYQGDLSIPFTLNLVEI